MGDLVLARWQEDCAWVGALFCPAQHLELTKLNVVVMDEYPEGKGQESGAYCRYILDNWDSLPEFVIFSQADPIPHLHNGVYDSFRNAIRKFNTEHDVRFIPIGMTSITVDSDPMVARIRERPRSWIFDYSKEPLKEACEYLFGHECPKKLLVAFGSIFLASKSAIKTRPKDFYTRMYYWLSHCGKSFEAGLMEKLWALVIDPRMKDAIDFDNSFNPIFKERA